MMLLTEKNNPRSSRNRPAMPSRMNRKIIIKKQKRTRLAISKKEQRMIMEACLLAGGRHIDVLLLSVRMMLTATRDLIQNNEVIPIESVRALKEQNEVLSKEIKNLNKILQKI